MILADTNIFIDFWNNPTEDLKNVFIKEDSCLWCCADRTSSWSSINMAFQSGQVTDTFC